MAKWDIWMGEWSAQGNLDNGPSISVRGVEGDTFKEACINHFKDDKYFDPVRMTYWGCTLAPSCAELYVK